MRTFHTVKAEEIVRIDGLNLEYDFRKNNRDAALTPHERIKDHDKRRHLATRPVNPVDTREHPEASKGDALPVVDTSGATKVAFAPNLPNPFTPDGLPHPAPFKPSWPALPGETEDTEVLTRSKTDAKPVDDTHHLPPMIKFTLTGGEIKEVPENELLIAEGVKVPGEGDYLIESYDIWTDKCLFKVYDKRTLDTIFKAGFT
jgi:hypothetical protein